MGTKRILALTIRRQLKFLGYLGEFDTYGTFIAEGQRVVTSDIPDELFGMEKEGLWENEYYLELQGIGSCGETWPPTSWRDRAYKSNQIGLWHFLFPCKNIFCNVNLITSNYTKLQCLMGVERKVKTFEVTKNEENCFRRHLSFKSNLLFFVLHF